MDIEDFCPHCHQVTMQILCVTFSLEDMQVKNIKCNRPLYYTGYIGYLKVNRIQVDLSSALSIIL